MARYLVRRESTGDYQVFDVVQQKSIASGLTRDEAWEFHLTKNNEWEKEKKKYAPQHD